MTISASGSCKYHDAVFKKRAPELFASLSPVLKLCGFPEPLERIVTSYAVELSEELFCMTITQIEKGGDKATSVAMKFINRCELIHGEEIYVMKVHSKDCTFVRIAGLSDQTIIQMLILDIWRRSVFTLAPKNCPLEISTPQAFKNRICFHARCLGGEFPDIDPENEKRLENELEEDLIEAAQQVVEALNRK